MHTVHIDCAGRELRLLRARGEQPMFRLDEDGPSLSDVVDSLWEESGRKPEQAPPPGWSPLDDFDLVEIHR